MGSASDTGAVLEALGFGLMVGDYTMELQTDAEPYGVTLRFQSLPQVNWAENYLTEAGRLALALMDNAGYIAFADGEGAPFLQVNRGGLPGPGHRRGGGFHPPLWRGAAKPGAGKRRVLIDIRIGGVPLL